MKHELLLIAGKGAYPLELAKSARAQGIEFLTGIAFKGETSREIESVCDTVTWLHVGHLASFREAVAACEVDQAVMAGQLTPSNLFLARLDKPMRDLLSSLPKRNADTIFGAIAKELSVYDVTLLPAYRFLESCRLASGVYTTCTPTASQQKDLEQGMELATTCAEYQAGQSVAVKEGTVIAVEGFEGTDQMILRAGKLGGPGCVVVKAAQSNHDQRWDIPVVGRTTLKSLKKAQCSCLAIEANQVIVLERDELFNEANQAGICIIAVNRS